MWTIALSLLRRFWPLIAVAAALVALGLYHSSKVRESYQRGYKQAHAELAAQLEKEREHWRELREEIDREHHEQKSALQRRVNRLLSRNDPIRMCEPSGEVRDPAGTGGGDGAGGADGQAAGAGSDLQPRLVQYGAGCESLRQEVERWQAWYRAHAR